MKQRISIHIGEYHASREPVVIQTLLGSCVAVCLYDPVEKIGGMNHILLPGKADMKHFNEPARYGINAMELLINRIMSLGGIRRRLVAKVFGGAHVLAAISKENGTGKKIAAFVGEFLRTESIRVASHDVGGRNTRKIFFHTDTGDVFLKRIQPTVFPSLVYKEREELEKVRKLLERPGDTTLF